MPDIPDDFFETPPRQDGEAAARWRGPLFDRWDLALSWREPVKSRRGNLHGPPLPRTPQFGHLPHLLILPPRHLGMAALRSARSAR